MQMMKTDPTLSNPIFVNNHELFKSDAQDPICTTSRLLALLYGLLYCLFTSVMCVE